MLNDAHQSHRTIKAITGSKQAKIAKGQPMIERDTKFARMQGMI